MDFQKALDTVKRWFSFADKETKLLSEMLQAGAAYIVMAFGSATKANEVAQALQEWVIYAESHLDEAEKLFTDLISSGGLLYTDIETLFSGAVKSTVGGVSPSGPADILGALGRSGTKHLWVAYQAKQHGMHDTREQANATHMLIKNAVAKLRVPK